MTSIVTLANQSYTIGITPVDSERRRLYFKDPNAYPKLLNAEEQRVLNELGIDDKMKKLLAEYLADFFDALPKCQSDAAVTLDAACEIPYYVLWATKFAEREQAVERLEEQDKTKRTRMDIIMAMDDAMIRNLKEKTIIKTPIEDVFTLIDITTLESLASSPNMNIKPSNQRPEPMTDIVRIFTLVDLERGDMLNLKSLERVEDA
ncbi:MAG: hypothetical protein EBU33_05225 [Sphingobacteriia bacterium]|nr:hypothetical protein [Sphingobacteriia bacterium]